MTPAELSSIEEGICIKCSSDDVECLEDCTVHKCVSCGHTLTTTDADICCYGVDCIGEPKCKFCGEAMEHWDKGEWVCPKGCGIPYG